MRLSMERLNSENSPTPHLLSDTEAVENLINDVLPGRKSDNFSKGVDRLPDIDGDQLERCLFIYFLDSGNRQLKTSFQGNFMPQIGNDFTAGFNLIFTEKNLCD